MLSIALAAILFWAAASHEPIFLPYNQGLWVQGHPKVSTVTWTALGSILSAFTIYCLRSMLVLVSKQTLDKKGVSLSTIECK